MTRRNQTDRARRKPADGARQYRRRASRCIAGCCLLLSLLVAPAAWAQGAGQEIDATIATVNGDLVLKSDVLWNLALDPNVAPAEFWDHKVQDMMLRTIIDQRLLLQEASKLPATQATTEEVRQEIGKLANEFNGNSDPTRFETRLRLVGLDMLRLEQIIRDRLQITKFVDFRFRSFVVVTEPEITAYFDAEIKPKLPDKTPAALAAALAAQRPQIEKLLVEEKINDAIDTYLTAARGRAEVIRLDAQSQTGGQQSASRSR
jgi:hypothetical protein